MVASSGNNKSLATAQISSALFDLSISSFTVFSDSSRESSTSGRMQSATVEDINVINFVWGLGGGARLKYT